LTPARERELVSTWTKAALAAARQRGMKLGKQRIYRLMLAGAVPNPSDNQPTPITGK